MFEIQFWNKIDWCWEREISFKTYEEALSFVNKKDKSNRRIVISLDNDD